MLRRLRFVLASSVALVALVAGLELHLAGHSIVCAALGLLCSTKLPSNDVKIGHRNHDRDGDSPEQGQAPDKVRVHGSTLTLEPRAPVPLPQPSVAHAWKPAAGGRCGGPSSKHPGPCDCLSDHVFCNERNGWCGSTAEHKAGSSGAYDCDPVAAASELEQQRLRVEAIQTNWQQVKASFLAGLPMEAKGAPGSPLRRIGFYGSSHTREIAFSVVSMSLNRPLSATERAVGSAAPAPNRSLCQAEPLPKLQGHPLSHQLCWIDRSEACFFASGSPQCVGLPDDSCFCRADAADRQRTLASTCWYVSDIGKNLEACGYPHIKEFVMWGGNVTGGRSARVCTNMDNLDTFELSKSGCEQQALQAYGPDMRASWPLSLLYAFKSWADEDERVLASALRHINEYQPDLMVLGLIQWGCHDQFSHRTHTITAACEGAVRHVVRKLAEVVPEHTRMVHLVNTFRGPASIESRFAAIHIAAVEGLPPKLRSRCLLLDKANVLRNIPSEQRQRHGYRGEATDTWARHIMELMPS